MKIWKVDKKDVDKNFSLQELLEYSRRPNTRVIIQGVMILQDGGVVELWN